MSFYGDRVNEIRESRKSGGIMSLLKRYHNLSEELQNKIGGAGLIDVTPYKVEIRSKSHYPKKTSLEQAFDILKGSPYELDMWKDRFNAVKKGSRFPFRVPAVSLRSNNGTYKSILTYSPESLQENCGALRKFIDDVASAIEIPI